MEIKSLWEPQGRAPFLQPEYQLTSVRGTSGQFGSRWDHSNNFKNKKLQSGFAWNKHLCLRPKVLNSNPACGIVSTHCFLVPLFLLFQHLSKFMRNLFSIHPQLTNSYPIHIILICNYIISLTPMLTISILITNLIIPFNV